MKAVAVLAGAMLVPKQLVPAGTLQQLIAKYQPMGSDVAIYVKGYTDEGKYWGLPRQYGIEFCRKHQIQWVDKTATGYVVDWPVIAAPRQYQVDVLGQLEQEVGASYDFMFKAHTGWGKTIGSLIIAARLGISTCVVVDQDNLKDQWIKAAKKHFGLTKENGGVAEYQGQKKDYKGRTLVIAMVQTLTRTEVDPDFYDEFGFVIFDEVHTIGAATFSQPLLWFNAQVRMGVSATPKRKDGLNDLLEWNLGKVKVAATQKHKKSAVYFVDSETVYTWYANSSSMIGRMLSEVSEDGRRNLIIAQAAHWLWSMGRDVLVLADRIEQLRHLESILYYLGVPGAEMGLYAGKDSFYVYEREAVRSRRPIGLTKYEGDATERVDYDDGTYEEVALFGRYLYTPLALQLISKDIPKKRLNHVRATCKIQLATYGMCAKGYDEPRISGGVDATPRSTVEQIHGRILRKRTDGKIPIWITVRDHSSYRLMNSFAMRVKDYAKSNAELFQWTEDGDIIPCQVESLLQDSRQRFRELKEMRIEQNSLGSNTLVTARSEKTRKRTRALDTIERIKSEKAESPTVSPRAVRAARYNTAPVAPSSSSRSPSRKPQPR